MDALIIILTGTLVAACCGILGVFLVLRKMAMVGDAISHAVLPGIVVAYLLSGSRDTVTMLVGAGLVGMFSTFLIEFLHDKGRLQSDASIGVTFTWLFALGVIMISLFANKVDLDQECVLYGEIAYVPFDSWILKSGTNLGPSVTYLLGFTLLLILTFVFLGYKELMSSTFDPSYSQSIGIRGNIWHYGLMGLVSFTSVASFEAVGAILVIAFLIAPPATAYLLTHDLKRMIGYTLIIGLLVAVSGYFIAAALDASISGAMATMSGILFTLAFLFAPETGLVTKSLGVNRKTSNV